MDNAEELAVKPEVDAPPQIDDEAKPETETVEGEETKAEPVGSVPLIEHLKLRKRAQEAERSKEAIKRERDAIKAERDTAMLAFKGKPKPDEEELSIPYPDDYIGEPERWKQDISEYQRKLSERMEQRSKSIASEVLQENTKTLQQKQLEEQQQAEKAKAYNAYIERADKLGDAGFLDAEAKVREVWSPQFFDYVVANIPNSEQLVWTLSKDPDKALQMAKDIDANFFKGGQALIEFAGSLDPIKKQADTLEADEPIKGGAGGLTDAAAKFDKEVALSREKNRTDPANYNMNKHLAHVKKLREKYGQK